MSIASPFTSSFGVGSSLPQELNHLFKSVEVFEEFSDDDDIINEICDLVHVRYYKDGDIIMREGELSKAIFFIIKGGVCVGTDDLETVYAELSAPGLCK